jgi:membrane-bound lytic murein transglycosylase B
MFNHIIKQSSDLYQHHALNPFTTTFRNQNNQHQTHNQTPRRTGLILDEKPQLATKATQSKESQEWEDWILNGGEIISPAGLGEGAPLLGEGAPLLAWARGLRC